MRGKYQPEWLLCGHFPTQLCSAKGCFPLAQNTRQQRGAQQNNGESYISLSGLLGLEQTIRSSA